MKNFWQKLNKPFLVLAPMEDVTDYVFREIISEIAKPDVLFTEFTSIDGLCSKGRDKTIRSLEYSAKQRPIVAQIWGTNPERFNIVAKLVKELGFDGVDINMGCPDRKVVKNGAGAALINNPNLAAEIISAVKDGVGDTPISVKTRLGFGKVETDTWIRFLLEQNLDALSIHARTARAKSTGAARWDEIKRIVELRDSISPETVVIGNGDVVTYQKALNKSKEYGCEGIMIGRGIFQNPWIFDATLYDHSIEDKLNLLLKHTKLFVDKWGDSKNFATMKKFFKIYVKGFNGADQLRQNLMKSKTYAEVENSVKKERDE